MTSSRVRRLINFSFVWFVLFFKKYETGSYELLLYTPTPICTLQFPACGVSLKWYLSTCHVSWDEYIQRFTARRSGHDTGISSFNVYLLSLYRRGPWIMIIWHGSHQCNRIWAYTPQASYHTKYRSCSSDPVHMV